MSNPDRTGSVAYVFYLMEECLVDFAAELAQLDPIAAQRALDAARSKAKEIIETAEHQRRLTPHDAREISRSIEGTLANAQGAMVRTLN